MAPASTSIAESPEAHGFAALAADSRTAAISTLVSRITGVGRVIAVAAVLGPTYFALFSGAGHSRTPSREVN